MGPAATEVTAGPLPALRILTVKTVAGTGRCSLPVSRLPLPGSSYFFAFSNSGRYWPYPSSANFATGMKRMDAEFMQ